MLASRGALVLLVFLFACEGANPTPGGEPFDDNTDGSKSEEGASPWDELDGPAVDFSGGVAVTSGGIGRDGGTIQLQSGAPVTIAAAAVSPLSIPPGAPAGGVTVDAEEVTGDLEMAETIRIGGTLPAIAGPPREIVSSEGHIVVDRRLRSAGRGLSLRAPRGTVHVAAPIDASAAGGQCNASPIVIEAASVVIADEVLSAGQAADDGLGCPGAAITIRATAGSVMIAGGLDSSGGSGRDEAGSAGDITIAAAADIEVDAPIDALGGEARGPTAIGGGAGNLTLNAGSRVVVRGVLRLRGGGARGSEADATGGDAGVFLVDAGGEVQIGGVVDGRGGPAAARGTGGVVSGGAAGSLLIGVNTWPAGITIAAPITAAGGGGPAAGGAGGDMTVTNDGDLRVEAAVALHGGSSARSPGGAGVFKAMIGPNSGGFIAASTIAAIGGSANGDAGGGSGGELWVEVISLTGPVIIEESAQIVFDGGRGAGDGAGGAGGILDLRCRDGNGTVSGQLIARGGAAEARGGHGGALNLWTDTNYDGIGGHLAVETTGLIDVSGGDGAIGGSARNNGGAGIGRFPTEQELIAVLLNSETISGTSTDGSLINRGMVIARGGAGGGWGGDVMFHGRQPGNSEDPLPGNMDLSGSDGGADGDFVPE